MYSKLLVFILLSVGTIHAEDSRPLNVIFLLTDDQGYGDISAHGNPILKTPNFDRLHRESVRFTNFHVSPTCAPTRSALLTGRHEFRNGVTHTILERERMALDTVTLPQVLKTVGYKTGIFGKWHLGDEAAYQPNQRGFDEIFIHGAGGIGQTFPGSCGDAPGNTYFDPAILHNGKFEKTSGFCTDVFFNQASAWIASQKKSEPFFCWIATNAPHDPYVARPEDRAIYMNQGLGEQVENFYGMIHNIDQNLGMLLDKLDQLGIAENTLVVAMNDNGGTVGVPVFNDGMRGSKCTPWLGGTRAFSLWRLPGRFEPADCDAQTAHVDCYRTIAQLANATLSAQAESQVEGLSLVPLLKQPSALWPDRIAISHCGRWPKGSDPDDAKFTNCSIRDSRYTLVSDSGTSTPRWQLFDVKEDPAQAKNLAEKLPNEVSRLSEAYDQWWISIKPQLINESAIGPKVNPFKELYWQQFGGEPSSEDLFRMDPDRVSELDGRKNNPVLKLK